LAVMTVGLARENFEFALANASAVFSGNRQVSAGRIITNILSAHLSLPALIVTAASVAVLIVRRRRQVVFGLVWIICVVGGSVVFAGATESGRYAFGAVPAYFLLTAGLTAEAHTRTAKTIVAALLTATLWWQLWSVRDVHPSGVGGYEAAAEYVLARTEEPAVLYDSGVDTGYFVFFVRKHDPIGRHIVLRADKIIGEESVDPEHDRAALHAALQRFGIRWVVVEERRPIRRFLRTFHEEYRGARFVERQRIPVVSTAAVGLNLLVYEYLDAKPPDYDAEVRIDVPLGHRDFAFRLRDIVKPR
jgi:hypothetical protein